VNEALRQCETSIAQHSRSFNLASRLLPPAGRSEAAVVYAWCRRADDAIDLCEPERQPAELERLRRELTQLYTGAAQSDPILSAFQQVALLRGIPEEYPSELLLGMQMDATGQHYESWDDLLIYCYRVASTVGLMMCHVMGVSDARALRHAAHLGIGMQLTNICRDVLEDWQRGRLYIPAQVLACYGAPQLSCTPGGPFPEAAARACRGALPELLGVADRYYASSDAGLAYLSFRCALSVNVARRVYSGIGQQIARQGHDVHAPRAVVPRAAKLGACLCAIGSSVARGLTRLVRPFKAAPLHTVTHGTELISL
jgi:15-cis-phytoene synthase